MKTLKAILNGIWQFCTYLFVLPIKSDKTRYDSLREPQDKLGSSQVLDAKLKEQITYIIGKERAEGCIDTPSPKYISKVLNVPLEEVEKAMKEMGI